MHRFPKNTDPREILKFFTNPELQYKKMIFELFSKTNYLNKYRNHTIQHRNAVALSMKYNKKSFEKFLSNNEIFEINFKNLYFASQHFTTEEVLSCGKVVLDLLDINLDQNLTENLFEDYPRVTLAGSLES